MPDTSNVIEVDFTHKTHGEDEDGLMTKIANGVAEVRADIGVPDAKLPADLRDRGRTAVGEQIGDAMGERRRHSPLRADCSGSAMASSTGRVVTGLRGTIIASRTRKPASNGQQLDASAQ